MDEVVDTSSDPLGPNLCAVSLTVGLITVLVGRYLFGRCSAGKCVKPTGKDPVVVTVTIGDIKRHTGTDNDVYVKFVDSNGMKSKSFKLANCLKNNFKAGNEDAFCIPDVSSDLNDRQLGEITSIEISRQRLIFNDGLFLTLVVVERVKTSTKYIFPVHRWIPMGDPLSINVYDSYLPQDDPHPEQRQQELDVKKELYQIKERTPGLPVQVAEVPDDEQFSWHYQAEFSTTAVKGFIGSKIKHKTSDTPKTLNDFKQFFDDNWFTIPEPFANNWYKRDDYFGHQRVAGCNPLMLQLCTSIPRDFAVTKEMIEPFLEKETLEDTFAMRRLFIINYEILHDLVKTKPELKIPAPLILLYRNKEEKLVPIAIQLEQKPGDNNPVFLPSDPPYTWLVTKIWCNLADSSVHQAKAHLGFTHLVAESICVVSHRELSPSHPVFKLLAPHFLYLLKINSVAVTSLLGPGGSIDSYMSMGRKGTYDILRRAKQTWRMDIDGNPKQDIKRRGVGVDNLPQYPYRDYAIDLYDRILAYVSEVVEAVYKAKGSVQRDHEIQAWYKVLGATVDAGGAGIQGIPGDGEEAKVEDVIETVTAMIFMSSVQHAAVNFNQYTEYAFPGNYPSILRGKPPTTKEALTERDVVDTLPDSQITTSMMMVATLLSNRATQSLGDFEIKYGYDPTSEAALKRFRKSLDELTNEGLKKEAKNEFPYTVLDPRYIPNAISI